MNSYAILILAFLLAEYCIGVAANLLNLRAMRSEIPPDISDLYNMEERARTREYTSARTRFRLTSSAFDLLLLLAFWFAGGFNSLDLLVRSWELSPIWTGVAYIGVLMIARAVISLPFSIYDTFVLEARFGFNKTTPALFAADRVKGLLLAVLLGGPLLAGVLAFFQYAGPIAWLYCWGAATLFILIVQFVAPAWIMPLFNRFKPLEEGELRRSILDYAGSVDFSLTNIFIIDGSRRSSRANAFFSGFGRFKRIALYDTLVANHTVPELVAVVAHEVGHYKRKHIVQGMIIAILHIGVLTFLLSFFLTERALYDAFYMEQSSIYAGLIFFGLLLSPVELVLSVLMQILSRRNEFEADRYATVTTQTPGAMIDALKKLSVDNLANPTPHPLFVFLYYSHPPLFERIRAIRGVTGGSAA